MPLTPIRHVIIVRGLLGNSARKGRLEYTGNCAMKVVNSLKSMKKRHKDCRVVRRRGRVYVINKTNPRFKARQG